jgi:lipopolysaccharide transport system ATP-binding protein
MAEDVVIRAEGLGKKYVIGHATKRERYVALRDVVVQTARNVWRKTVDLARGRAIVSGDTTEDFWALQNVNFEIKRGEVVGIIGRNGAGKSTLLKILSRITEPTEGEVTINGRVASLLEVGTGFHPELTGRENIYLNGAILGMTRAEIKRKFDDIVAFAEIEKFLDTPVKRYSSGMYVRLAFAVAAHLEPEILVVDEVLAVGDAEFQKKCLGKMNDASQRDGKTVLLVSHNMGAIASLAQSAIWLDAGLVRRQGVARDVISEYLAQSTPNVGRILDLDCNLSRTGSDDRLRLVSLEWLRDLPLRHGEPLKARINFKTRAPLADVAVGIGFSNIGGTRLLTYETDFQDEFRPTLSQPGNYSVGVEVASLPLGPDVYYLDIGCRAGGGHDFDYIPGAAQIEIVAGSNTPGYIIRKGVGVRLASSWTWEHLE